MGSRFRFAHLSDVHVLDPKTPSLKNWYRVATKLVSLGRPVDPPLRASRLSRALSHAKDAGADHVVISGDLTEMGSDREFEAFGAILGASRFTPDSVTLVPGNHDRYTTHDGWERALQGPLRPWARSSAHAAGHVVDRGEVVFLPVDSSCYQSIARSGGEISEASATVLRARLNDEGLRNRSLVLVQHHPPAPARKGPVVDWIDGLRGWRHLLDTFQKHPNLAIVHGHLHRAIDRVLGLTRAFGASATVDDEGAPRVRMYDLQAGTVVPL